MLTRSQAREALIELIRPYIRLDDKTDVTDASRFVEDLGANSARLVDIVLETEDRFHISIDDREADGLTSVGDAVDLILVKQPLASRV